MKEGEDSSTGEEHFMRMISPPKKKQTIVSISSQSYKKPADTEVQCQLVEDMIIKGEEDSSGSSAESKLNKKIYFTDD